ncbi:acyl transferase [uncultured Planktosalinus sp.]|uniref:LuxE/PaaK family acyltransferase n=1 Tax=uncultured Planktosalinus sp. TaxID=1810935 RepID=UPI0030DA0E81
MRLDSIFTISSAREFEQKALKVFQYQFENNSVYRSFCDLLYKHPSEINTINEIPFLPIEFFKTKKVISTSRNPQAIFTSSGTTGSQTSKHLVPDLNLYKQSFNKGFNHFYGPVEDYVVLGLLPSYLEREGSSLIYMVNDFIAQSNHTESGFYLNQYDVIAEKLKSLDAAGKKVLLIGVSFALLDLIEKHQFSLKSTIVMETGGMKGRRKELIRSELHAILKQGFGVSKIHSEYGMTELLSQAYSKGDGIFNCPPWMKVLTRDTEDPLTVNNHHTGGINIIDLANINSCSFIATQDLGKVHTNGSFEVLGRFDSSDIRGCNLMVL